MSDIVFALVVIPWLLVRLSDAASVLERARTTAELENDVHSFNQWIEEGGLLTIAVSSRKAIIRLRAKVVNENTFRIGAVARTTIHAGDVYVALPREALLSQDTLMSRHPNLDRIWAINQDPINNLHALILLLLLEVDLGSKSAWSPYINLLPRASELTALRYWSNDEREWLRGTTLYDEILEDLERTHRDYKSFKVALLDNNDDILRAHVTRPLYIWARTIVESRSIWMNGKRHLIPVLDLVNCGVGQNPDRVHITSMVDGYAETRAPDDVKHGMQIFENYGQPNHNYLRYHGFILEDNPQNCLHLRVEAFQMSDPRAREKFGVLQSQGINSRAPTLCIKTEKPLSHQLIWTIAIASAPNNEPIPRTYLEERTIKRACRYLVNLARQTILAFGTTIDEDEQLLAGPNMLTRKQSIALKFRLNVKRMLNQLVVGTKQRLRKAEHHNNHVLTQERNEIKPLLREQAGIRSKDEL